MTIQNFSIYIQPLNILIFYFAGVALQKVAIRQVAGVELKDASATAAVHPAVAGVAAVVVIKNNNPFK